MLRLTDIPLNQRRVLIRTDFNVPLKEGKITSAARIEMVLDTIRLALAGGAKVMLMSHLGRPEEGRNDAEFSLAPVAKYLNCLLDREVKLCTDYLTHPPTLSDGEVVVLENVRFNIGEKNNDKELAQKYAELCDVFVMDAFGTAHRTQASTCGVARYARKACAGPLLLAELDALGKVMEAPRRPLVAIVGGAKTLTKLNAIDALVQHVDQLIPGGGIANTFLKHTGCNIGKSLHDEDFEVLARGILVVKKLLNMEAMEHGCNIELPVDVVVAKTLSNDAHATIKPVGKLADDDRIFDIGPQTIRNYSRIIAQAGTIIWNGPVGVFELAPFAAGTEAVGRAVAESEAFSVAGGGDTLAAIEQFNLAEKISCISTGGGAFLELLEGKTLPAVAALESRAE